MGCLVPVSPACLLQGGGGEAIPDVRLFCVGIPDAFVRDPSRIVLPFSYHLEVVVAICVFIALDCQCFIFVVVAIVFVDFAIVAIVVILNLFWFCRGRFVGGVSVLDFVILSVF